MTVEIKKLDQLDKISKSDLEIIKQHAGLNDKKSNIRRKTFVKKTKPSKKKIIKNEKKLAKQARINELKRIKNEKKLAKTSLSIEKKKKAKAKKQYRKKNPSKKYSSIKKNKVNTEFKNLVNRIIKRKR